MMPEISSASAGQTSGIDQANMTIGQMDGATRKNVALAAQAVAVAQSLEAPIQGLSEIVAYYKVNTDSHNVCGGLSQSGSFRIPPYKSNSTC